MKVMLHVKNAGHERGHCAADHETCRKWLAFSLSLMRHEGFPTFRNRRMMEGHSEAKLTSRDEARRVQLVARKVRTTRASARVTGLSQQYFTKKNKEAHLPRLACVLISSKLMSQLISAKSVRHNKLA